MENSPSGIIGGSLIVVISAAIAVGVFFIGNPATLDVEAQESGDSVQITDASNIVDWSDVDVMGCDKPRGDVSPGDVLTNCSGEVTIIHNDRVVWQGDVSGQ